jgi:hypothetical protein
VLHVEDSDQKGCQRNPDHETYSNVRFEIPKTKDSPFLSTPEHAQTTSFAAQRLTDDLISYVSALFTITLCTKYKQALRLSNLIPFSSTRSQIFLQRPTRARELSRCFSGEYSLHYSRVVSFALILISQDSRHSILMLSYDHGCQRYRTERLRRPNSLSWGDFLA